MIDEHAFFVIVERGGRMYPCKDKHETREEADACVAAHDGIAIIEWVRDRRPQFAFPWVREDCSSKALEALVERFS